MVQTNEACCTANNEAAYRPMCSNEQMQKQFVIIWDKYTNMLNHDKCRKVGSEDFKKHT